MSEALNNFSASLSKSGFRKPGKNPDPSIFVEQVRKAAQCKVDGGSMRHAAHVSGLSYNTLISWTKPEKAESRSGKLWRQMLEQCAARRGVDPVTGERPAKPAVSTEGFESPEQLCDRWSLEAARVQVECMVDPEAPRKDRLDAAKRVQDLGGHSPVNRSVVITAPLDDPRLANVLMGVLAEVKQMRGLAPAPPAIEAHFEEAP